MRTDDRLFPVLAGAMPPGVRTAHSHSPSLSTTSTKTRAADPRPRARASGSCVWRSSRPDGHWLSPAVTTRTP